MNLVSSNTVENIESGCSNAQKACTKLQNGRWNEPVTISLAEKLSDETGPLVIHMLCTCSQGYLHLVRISMPHNLDDVVHSLRKGGIACQIGQRNHLHLLSAEF